MTTFYVEICYFVSEKKIASYTSSLAFTKVLYKYPGICYQKLSLQMMPVNQVHYDITMTTLLSRVVWTGCVPDRGLFQKLSNIYSVVKLSSVKIIFFRNNTVFFKINVILGSRVLLLRVQCSHYHRH